MKIPSLKIFDTSMGTKIRQLTPEPSLYKVTEDVKVYLDTPIQGKKGTSRTFMTGSVVDGAEWVEANLKERKQRTVVLVKAEDGRYLVPAKYLVKTTQAEVDAMSELEKLRGNVDELVEEAKKEANSLTESGSGFLDQRFVGFSGKQILVGAIGVIILIKLFK
jgi:hypothetical protein